MKIEIYSKLERLKNPLKITKNPYNEYFKFPYEGSSGSYDVSHSRKVEEAFEKHSAFFEELPLIFSCLLTQKITFNEFIKELIDNNTVDGLNAEFLDSPEDNKIFVKDFKELFSKNLKNHTKLYKTYQNFQEYSLSYELRHRDGADIKSIKKKILLIKIPFSSNNNETKLTMLIFEQIIHNLLFSWEGASFYCQLYTFDLGMEEVFDWDVIESPLKYKNAKLPKGYLKAVQAIHLINKAIKFEKKSEQDTNDLESAKLSLFDFINNNYGKLIKYSFPHFTLIEYLKFFYAFSMRSS
jgi:hypothetical protein